jgi:insertion element IS1 protein InsB
MELELDEIWSFVQTKFDKCWIWLVICRTTKLILGFVTGARGYKTGKQLYHKIQCHTNNQTTYYTDYWESYEKFLPLNQHIQSKAQTYTIEGYNSNFRDDLQRLTRRTKAYSKSQDMLDYSLYLYIYKHNSQQISKLKGIYGV